MDKYSFSTENMDNYNMIHTDAKAYCRLSPADVKAITIALKPEWMTLYCDAETDIWRYCRERDITFKLWRENENSNTHYHGIVRYPNTKTQKNFQLWINKIYGKVLHCRITDPDSWIDYCLKSETSSGDYLTGQMKKMMRTQYMFDYVPEYVPTTSDLEEFTEWYNSVNNPENIITLPLEDLEEVHLIP